jgi:hypothetical protein
MSEELRRVRDTLIEELRRSDVLTVAGRALFARYAAMSDAESGVEAPAQEPAPASPARPPRAAPVDEDEEFPGSFMVRSSTPPNIPGYRDTPPDIPRSIRDRRR